MKPFHVSHSAIYYTPHFSAKSTIALTSLAVEQFAGETPVAKKDDAAYGGLLCREALAWLHHEKIPLSNLALARQVHGVKVKYIAEPGLYEGVDGFFTDRQDLYLAIRTADCAAVMVSSTETPFVGIAHAGWRGANGNIVGELLQEMNTHQPLDVGSLKVAIAPHIKKCCYGVGEEFGDFFPAELLQRREGKLYFDLEKIILAQLKRRGIRRQNIAATPFCTACSSIPLYSFRKQKTAKRLLNLIAIKGGDL